MDNSLTLQLQQAWLLTQLNKRSSSPSPSSADMVIRPFPELDALWSNDYSGFASNFDNHEHASDNGIASFMVPSSPSWPSLQAELAALAESWQSPTTPSSKSEVSSSSSVSWTSSHGASVITDSACGVDGFEDDALMDPVLDFISDMLMDEHMEDRKCMQQECTAYQAIANGFYEILREESSPPRNTELGALISPEELESDGEDYSWIDEVLVADPTVEGGGGGEASAGGEKSSPWPFESSSSSGSDQDLKLLPWSFDSTTSSSGDQDLRLWGLGSSAGVSPYSQGALPGTVENPHAVNVSSLLAPPLNGFRALQSFENPFSFENGDAASSSSLPRRVRSEEVAPVSQHLHPVVDRVNGLYRRSNSEQLSYIRKSLYEDSIAHKFDSKSRSSSSITFVNGGLMVGSNGGGRTSSTGSSSVDQPVSFVKNADLNAEKHAKIYGEWSPEDGRACRERKKKQSNGSNSGASSASGGKRGGSTQPDAVDLRGLLVSCAQAVAANDLRKGHEVLQEVRQHASPHGSAAQRLAHYFAEGLVARLSGTGARLYTAMSNNRPSAAKMLKAFHLMVEVCPYAKLSHFFANQSILKAAEGASRLHIVDYGILYGLQWPCLISALAERKGGPPFLRVTGIEFPHPGVNPAERVQQTGARLAEYARTYNVPFEYHAIATKWEDVDEAALKLRKGEVLVINSIHRLRNLMDETVVSASPRRKVLSRMRSFNPDMVLIGVMNAGFNAPFFVSRFREALYHFSSKFDMIEMTVGDRENPERLMLETEVLGRDILNVVACEGPERVERPETYRQWQARFQRAGFELLPLSPPMVSKARAVVKNYYHKDFSVDDDSKWMLLGWKGRIVEGLSAWRPSPSGAAR